MSADENLSPEQFKTYLDEEGHRVTEYLKAPKVKEATEEEKAAAAAKNGDIFGRISRDRSGL